MTQVDRVTALRPGTIAARIDPTGAIVDATTVGFPDWATTRSP